MVWSWEAHRFSVQLAVNMARRTKVYQALLKPRLLLGARREFVAINGMITALVVLFSLQAQILTKIWPFAPAPVLLHIFLVWLTHKDPMIIEIYRRYMKQGDRYDPWGHGDDE